MIRVIAAALFAFGLLSAPAVAQAPSKIFVASTGNDANDGGRATPKRSFQAAHNAVAAAGEIVVLDTAGYGSVTITKSVSIVVPQGVSGFVTVTDGSGTGVKISAGTDDVVTLRGLIVEGIGSGYGIYATSVGTLVIEDTIVRNFSYGILARVSNNVQLVVRGGAVRTSGSGIELHDSVANVHVDALVTDTEFTGNENAFLLTRFYANSTVHLLTSRCAISRTIYSVFRAVEAGANIVADGCSIGGDTGKVFDPFNGAIIYSRGNNTIYGNGTLGIAPTTLSGQ